MEEHTIKIAGMTCGSCEKLISKEVSKLDGVEVVSISASGGRLVVRAPKEKLGDIRSAIEAAGYRSGSNGGEITGRGGMDADAARTETGAASSCCNDSEFEGEVEFSGLVKNIFSSKPEWKAERALAINTVGSLVLLLALLSFMYLALWRGVPNFAEKMLPMLAIVAVSVAAVVGTGYHFASYKKPISCSIGMMEGMTFGMMAGFLVGALVGATNGMFWGSTVGLAVGCAAGVWGGKRSGVMGIMEGLMAGVMSGTMGAMLSVMLLAEPLVIFLALLALSCYLILAALSYMNVKELGRLGKSVEVPSILSMASYCLIFFVFLSMIMIYGPKSGPVWGA